MITIVPFSGRDRARVRQFLQLPFRLYAQAPQWVPPLAMDAGQYLDPNNPFYLHSEAQFILALEGSEVQGRIAVLNNRRYNEYNTERTAFFHYFECANRPEVAQALFDAAFEWSRSRGLDKIVGPKGFTALDGMGVLVRGFEHRPAFGIAYNPPFYARLIEAAGFNPQGELVSGYLDATAPVPERIDNLAEAVKRRRGLRVLRFRTSRELRRIVPYLHTLYNGSLAGTTGTLPLTDDDVNAMASQLEWFADPRLVKIVMKGDDVVGFLLAYPDISAALQRTRGKLLPLGWADLWLELKRTRWVNINGAGIVERYRGLGGTALLFSEMHRSIVEAGYRHADIVQIGVENDRMQREMRDLGIEFYKAHRVYVRAL